MRRIVWAVATAGLLAAAACGKADKDGASAGAGPAAAPVAAVEPPFNAGLCQSELNAKKGANAQIPGGGCVVSPAKTFAMVMMNSGEMKVAPVSAAGALGATIFTTATHATTPGSSSLAFQEDGNLVIYDQPGNKPTWASASTGPLEPYHLALNDQGDVLITQVSSGKTMWSSKTGLPKTGAAAAAPANAAT